MMKLAVISDLHIGLAACAKDLCPEPPAAKRNQRAKYNMKIYSEYRKNFVQFIEKENITADYLILPGDLTNTAHPEEIKLVSEFILQAADALRVEHRKIVFVPGNHDIDWSLFDASDKTGLRWSKRYDIISHNNFPFKQIIDGGSGNLFSSPFFTLWTFDDLIVLAYNSASSDDPNGTQGIHHGLANPQHLEEIRTCLQRIGPTGDRNKLFLVHHHLMNFSNPVPETPDFSLMTNSENLLSLLHEYKFDLVIHGHMHHPRFEIHSTQTYPHLPILCSGSFSVEIDTRWAGVVGNQFHLVGLDGREGTENMITGSVTSWTNNYSRGWMPSEEAISGIHHVIPFGNYLMPQELDQRLKPYIEEWLTHHDYILWRQIIVQFPDLKHLPLNSAIEAFRRISPQLNRQHMYDTFKDLIMY